MHKDPYVADAKYDVYDRRHEANISGVTAWAIKWETQGKVWCDEPDVRIARVFYRDGAGPTRHGGRTIVLRSLEDGEHRIHSESNGLPVHVVDAVRAVQSALWAEIKTWKLT